MIVAFVTNYTLQNGIENVTMSARVGVDDTRVYLKSTSSHIRHILVENYGELNQNLRKTLDDTAGTVVKQLEDTSKAVKLKQLNTFVEKLPQIQNDLERMKILTSVMRTNASQLNDGEYMCSFLDLLFKREKTYKTIHDCRSPERQEKPFGKS